MSVAGLATCWSGRAPQFHSALRIVAAAMCLTAGTTILFAFPAGMPPDGGTAPFLSQIWIGGVLEQASRAKGAHPVPERPRLLDVRHVSVSIGRPPGAVYAFAAEIENLPKWAAGLCKTIRSVNGEWIADGGPTGPVKVRFTERNALGVLDHDVVLPSGASVHNPIRVVPNGTGSELTFTLLRQPGVAAEAFERDAQAVERDLRTLKALVEKMP